MVRREPNGQYLYWIQDGVKIEVYMMEPSYGVVQATQDAQIIAKRENATAKTNYASAVAQAQVSEDASRPYPPPVEPLMIVVTDPVMDDEGNVTQGQETTRPWVPPLPGVVPKVVNAPSNVGAAEPKRFRG